MVKYNSCNQLWSLIFDIYIIYVLEVRNINAMFSYMQIMPK